MRQYGWNTTQHEITQVQHDTTRIKHEITRDNTSTIRHNTSTARPNTSKKEAAEAKIGLYITFFVAELYNFFISFRNR